MKKTLNDILDEILMYLYLIVALFVAIFSWVNADNLDTTFHAPQEKAFFQAILFLLSFCSFVMLYTKYRKKRKERKEQKKKEEEKLLSGPNLLKYLRGTLSPSESKIVEKYMSKNDDLRIMVDRLREAIKKHGDETEEILHRTEYREVRYAL